MIYNIITFLNISENGICGFTTRILMVDKNFVEIYLKLKKNFPDKSEEELIFKTLVESKRNRLIFSGEKSLNYKISLKILVKNLYYLLQSIPDFANLEREQREPKGYTAPL